MKSKNYQNYNLEDFLADQDFKQWVQGKDTRRDYFWRKWIESHPEMAPTALKARELLLAMRFEVVEVAENEPEEVLEKILQGRWSGYRDEVRLNDKVRHIYPKRKIWWSVAASLFVVSMVYLFARVYQYGQTLDTAETPIAGVTKSTCCGQKLTFQLPDGSKVVLNAESKITFPSSFGPDSRQVTLKGEAYFDVVHDAIRPFSVKVGDVTTNVLGTTFNINAFPENEEVQVSLLTGKVEVVATDKSSHSKSIVLKPGEKLSVKPKTMHTYKTSLNRLKDFGWKDGILVFDGDDYQTVVSKLERWYGVQIKIVNNPGTRWDIQGRFQNLSLEEVLKSLKYTHHIEYKIQDKNVELKFPEL